jgi:hypothetical protein
LNPYLVSQRKGWDSNRQLESRAGRALSLEEKLWWQAKRVEQREFIWREYPSTLDECFRSPECDSGLTALEAYHKAHDSPRLARNEPLHDWSSHAADAFRTPAEADMAGLIPHQSFINHTERPKPRVIMGTRF